MVSDKKRGNLVTRYTNLRSPFVVEVTLHVLLLFLLLVFHRYMCDAVRRDFALSASFVLECLDGSEVTTREGNELVVQKENCVVRLFLYGRVFGKIHYCRLKFIVTLKIEKGLHLNRYRSNCNTVRFLRKGQLQN